jgi:hypothetical protein
MVVIIAYATAIAQVAVFIGRPYVISGLLGEIDDIGRRVITLPKPFETCLEPLHWVNFIGNPEARSFGGRGAILVELLHPALGVILGRIPTS